MRSIRKEVTLELDELIIIGRRNGSILQWCSDCKCRVLMLTPDEATTTTRATTRSLYRMIEAGDLHFSETQSGLLRLCLPSLVDTLAKRE